MSNKKNIDRLFQEKFKEFDVKPDPKVWKNIESKLKKEEKDDKVVIIPFWLKLSGIAASFLLLFFLGDAMFNDSEKPTIPKVVGTEKTNSNESIIKNEDNSNKIELKNLDSNKTVNQETDSLTSTTVVGTKSKISNKDNDSKVSSINKNKNSLYKTTKGSNKLVNNSNFSGNSSVKNNKANNLTTNLAQNTNNNSNQNIKDNTISSNKKESNTSTNNSLIKDAVAANNDENKVEGDKEEKVLKQSIEDAIAETKDNENPIEEEEDVNNRWSVIPNVAPVYYSSFGEGSQIHSQFNENTKSSEINTSYGVKVGYALNDKLTVRSGINKLNLSYDTDDVVVYEKLGDNSSLKNVNFLTSNSGSELNLIHADNVKIIEDSKSEIVTISQQMSYYEVPLEVEYKLLSKRIGINVIGGFSTFLLDDNQLRTQLDGIDSKIGEANNINSVSFSTNLGIGIDYKFSKAFVLNVEPTFKYHLNAFNNTSGSFNPYIIGLYTGVSYRF